MTRVHPKRTASLLTAILLVAGFGFAGPGAAQEMNRVEFNGQPLWLSGGNVAWVNFARDIGPGTTDFAAFERIFKQVHENGGNSMRLWLHTTGENTPAWNGNAVSGPGAGAISDLRRIVDLAWENEVGLILCLWSFDMMVTGRGTTVLNRSRAILTEDAAMQTYIDNALIPMVDSLEGNPGVIAWEIFNEAEGMSNEFGWSHTTHVPMSAIQRFVNRTAGAIHRADLAAKVTTGAWAFQALTDVPISGVSGTNNRNYYRDDRLVAAGGDADGTLDFYTVHYYEWAGTAQSPFHHDYSTWGLTKPLVVAEFFMGGGDDGNPNATYSVPQADLYTTLYDRGYAGAMAWQWYNYPNSGEGVINWPRALAGMKSVLLAHPEAVDVVPGVRILAFTARPPDIETGGSSVLTWRVSGATTTTLDVEPVDSIGTRTVSPETTTTYTLRAKDEAGGGDTLAVTVRVLDPSEINCSLNQPVRSSTTEQCCGNDARAVNAVDGDLATRWSSAWEVGDADDDPADEWIDVDLGRAYSLDRVVLRWEAAYGAAYGIDVSYDGRLWTRVFTETNGNGGVDEIAFLTPVDARYVRMTGERRGGSWGYSLWEMETYGLPAENQPPEVAIATPMQGALFAPGDPVTLTATATDDGSIADVTFVADGEELGTVSTAPYTLIWDAPPGDHTVMAVARDDEGARVSSTPFPLFVAEQGAAQRYEWESAAYTGDVTRVQRLAGASASQVLDMKDSGTITLDGLQAEAPGEYLLVLGYRLAYDTPKGQLLYVNGDSLGEVLFAGERNAWLRRGVVVPLNAGSNSVEIRKGWGWMQFDYIDLVPTALRVGRGEAETLPALAELLPSFPNPFRERATIPFTLGKAADVRLEVFDAAGRRVAVIAEGFRAAGRYEATLSSAGLAAGVYFCRLQAGASSDTQPLVIVQ